MGKQLVIRVREKGARGDKCYEYKNEISLSDPNMLAIVFKDLMDMYNAPIEKALKLTKNEDNFFPFLSK